MFKGKSTQRDGFAIDTLIGPDVVVRGDLEFSGGLYVEGRIVGKVQAAAGKPASLILSENGVIEGEIHAPVVVINGELTGDVHASERIELAPKARVQGNVHYAVVEMSAGAQLTGRLVHAQAQAKALPAPDAAGPAGARASAAAKA
ncbi:MULTISPECIES: polymer-forming cytoskeletal protein [Pseudoxanthomonas]|uniref:bactofilin family protein n=1 Tax=Pseudoxanthomonas TaxID=83618 RepID=UPI00139114CD|nr:MULTISPECIES: polymer-forming cytoskeletal protein [Pseudoxanthomonas]KAF1697297.1 cell shape determination protein CcmA [Pseudoxanthomonas jiangsuensis]MCR6685703.1 polymer-forming cytoskeletal protein [Pseudoxanthomonas sp.]